MWCTRIALMVVLWLSSIAYGQDLSALQASQDLAGLQQRFIDDINALNSRNLSATTASVDDRVTLFASSRPSQSKGKRNFIKLCRSTSTTMNTQ
jgi:hypothetical protein